MIKATEVLHTTLGSMADSGHPDLDVGVKNVENVLVVWKNNLNEVADKFRNATSTIRGDISNLPRELETAEKESKASKSKCAEDLKKANSKVEKISKIKKAMAKDPTALVNAMKSVTEKESISQKVTMETLGNVLQLLRVTYGQLFKCFKTVFVTKITSDEKSEQIINAQMKDMDKLIKSTKSLPQRYRSMVAMKKQSMINTTWLSPELKSILRDAGVRPRDLANPEIVETLINTVKMAVDEGMVSSELLEQLQRSKSNKDDKVGKVVDINQYTAPPKNNVPSTPTSTHSTQDVRTAAPPPPPPPPPPPMGNVGESAPPPPPPRQSNANTGGFLSDINQGGFALKKAGDRPEPKQTSATGKTDLTSMLRQAMQVRRNDIADDEEEEEDEDWDDEDEWDD
ncbi:WH2 domain-containing protein [Entamoeba marina]